MMKKLVLTIALLWAILPNAQACDGCGCSLSQIYWGLVPNNTNHYIGIWWQHQRYASNLGILNEDPGNEWFNSLEIRARYQLTPRLQLMAILPYAHHVRMIEGRKTLLTGLGDVVAMGSYTLFNNQDSLQFPVRHRLAAGFGIKAPTGEFRQPDEQEEVNPNFQVGSGSWDFLFNLTYTLRLNRFGLSADATYRKNTTNVNDYRFGDRLNGSVALFYMTGFKQFELMPNVGFFGEHANHNVQENYYRTDTGGYALFGTVGLEIYTSRFNLGFNYNHPFSQEVNNGAIENQSRASVHLNYFF